MKYMLFLCLCITAMKLQQIYRTPDNILVPALPWIGIVIGTLSVALMLQHVLLHTPDDHVLRRMTRWVDWAALCFIIVFLGYGGYLYANATLIQSETERHRSMVLMISEVSLPVGDSSPIAWVRLRSWRDPGSTETLLINGQEWHRLWGGEAVVVSVREGLFDHPWVLRIDRDEEYYAQQVLASTPTAALAWHNLIDSHMGRGEWDQVVTAARAYLTMYPNDYAFAHNIGTYIPAGRYVNDKIFFLEYALKLRPNYDDDQLLGVAYLYSGNPQKAAEILKASIPLRPKDWEAYYHVGLIDMQQLKRYDEAASMFEQVLGNIPHFPMIEQYLAEAQAKMAETGQPRQSGTREHSGPPSM
ncbi:MAG TPA: tetratricopeptide repeat protein [Nitrospiria bacterium]|nr:tetratricopeptide repeat protein [Nitrospiria bacterium]